MTAKIRHLALLTLLVLLADVASALDIHVLRHAQTMANVTREYTEENQRTFSPLGLEQLEGIADKLAPYSFDVILVSPAWRTRHTILPYLEAEGRTAEIWPELDECCWDRESEIDIEELPLGPPIELEEEWRAYFTFRDADAVHRFEADTPEAGAHQIGLAADLIRERFQDSGQSILIVSHTHAGARLVRALSDDPPARLYLQNATLTHLTLEPDGRFRLRMLNDEPVDMGAETR